MLIRYDNLAMTERLLPGFLHNHFVKCNGTGLRNKRSKRSFLNRRFSREWRNNELNKQKLTHTTNSGKEVHEIYHM